MSLATGKPFEGMTRPFRGADLAALALVAAFIYAVVIVAREWTGSFQAAVEIHTDARYLPLYAVYSLSRGLCAYALSFLFTMAYGYAMARIAGADRWMLPLLDVLQSVPVLGFLPGVVLGLLHLFPRSNIGLELASVLMVFTGQVWNMTFSFYASLKTVPPDLAAVARLARMSGWERFLRLDLAFAATGLIWNSMVSMAGGWFFLTVSEAFVLGERDFRLPGLGSYMSVAIERGDARGQLLGVLAMIVMIVFFDRVVWRPILAWSRKFGDNESAPSRSWLWSWVPRSWLWQMAAHPFRLVSKGSRHCQRPWFNGKQLAIGLSRRLKPLVLCLVAAALMLGVFGYIRLLTGMTSRNWAELFSSAGATFLRVIAAVILASLWTIPVGVALGRQRRSLRAAQPFIQMAASFPAPMIFPWVVTGTLALGINLGVGAIALLLISTQWYLLFNVIAGTSAIPHELWEVARLARFSWRVRWRVLVLPALFPSLLTGWITAMGGAWNASIVAEYMRYHGQTLVAPGLGAVINQATERGDFHVLAAAVGLMAAIVVGFNRLVWRPLSHLAQTRYSVST